MNAVQWAGVTVLIIGLAWLLLGLRHTLSTPDSQGPAADAELRQMIEESR